MAPRRSEATRSQTRKKTNTTVTKKYKAWMEIDLMRAVVAVREGQLTKKAARRVYGVPERTLTRYLDGRMITAVAGRVSAVSDQEEDGIVEALLDRARLGFSATCWRLRAMILDVISDGRAHQFGKAGPSDRWIASFLDRHASRISVRKGRILDTTRVHAVKKTEIEYFFAEYEAFLKEHQIPASQIFNCDETGVDPQGGTLKSVIAARGAKDVSVRRGANRENTSVLLSISATGAFIPPLFIFKGETLPSDFLTGSPTGSVATTTENAFIDTVVFNEWLDHFIASIPSARPVLLTLDSHISHIGLQVRLKCIQNDIHLLSFPPHTTHILQPLDAGCFRTFKSMWRDTIEEWAVQHNADNLPRHCRAEVIGHALLESLSIKGVMNSWKSTGLWPLDQAKALVTVSATCNAEPKPQLTYSRYVAVQDTFPIEKIDARGLRKLAKAGIDVAAFRTYTIVNRDLAKAPEARKRSPNKTLVKVKTHFKRLLTHDDCMAIEVQKAAEKQEGEESKLMKREDSASKKIELENRKSDRLKQRQLVKKRKEEESKLKKAETEARRAAAKPKAAKRPRNRGLSLRTDSSTAVLADDVIAYADI